MLNYYVSASTKKMNLPFSDAVIVGNWIFLSGQIGNIPGTPELAKGGIKGETRQAMKNIKAVLEANGSSLSQIVKCTIMMADMEEWHEMNEEYIKFFPKSKPARSALGANGLALNAKVEIECIACKVN